MEIISIVAPKPVLYVGSCVCGCIAKFERSEAQENIPVEGGLAYGLVTKCPNCEDGVLYSPYKIFTESEYQPTTIPT